jgi:hypothetical protein
VQGFLGQLKLTSEVWINYLVGMLEKQRKLILHDILRTDVFIQLNWIVFFPDVLDLLLMFYS